MITRLRAFYRDLPTDVFLFGGIALFTGGIGVVYAAGTALTGEIEPAGTLVLVGAMIFAGMFALFLWRAGPGIEEDRQALEEAQEAGDPDAADVLYLPSTSIWPAGLAVGATLVLAGIPLGLWVMIPGLAISAHCIIGFAQQTRTRS
jgi:hypothetical protein